MKSRDAVMSEGWNEFLEYLFRFGYDEYDEEVREKCPPSELVCYEWNDPRIPEEVENLFDWHIRYNWVVGEISDEEFWDYLFLPRK